MNVSLAIHGPSAVRNCAQRARPGSTAVSLPKQRKGDHNGVHWTEKWDARVSDHVRLHVLKLRITALKQGGRVLRLCDRPENMRPCGLERRLHVHRGS